LRHGQALAANEKLEDAVSVLSRAKDQVHVAVFASRALDEVCGLVLLS